MSNKIPEGEQIQTIPFTSPYVYESFDLNRSDAFVKSLGTAFYHWKSTPSPIGLNDKGDYRRNQPDVMTSNGYIYSFGGKFTATMTGNQRNQVRPTDSSLIDSSTAYLVMPRFYDSIEQPNNENGGCENPPLQPVRIHLAPGDRLYFGSNNFDDLVPNKELLTFSYNAPGITMFPAVRMDAPVVDSRGIFYKENVDFKIVDGNIIWLPDRPNPGIDPDTGNGRTYSCRYLYHAFYYVTSILREVRVTEVTENGVRRPERMPQFVEIVREYIYHNINQGNEVNKPPVKAMEKRQVPQPIDNIGLQEGMVRVETTDIDDDT